MKTDGSSRRDFLLSSGVFGVMTMLSVPASRASAGDGEGPVATLQRPAPSLDDPVTPTTFAEAEKLVGISFSDDEREMMAKSIGRDLARMRSRLDHPFHPHDLAPATTFDPRLFSMDLSYTHGRFTPSRGPFLSLPDDDADIAYAPLTHLSRWIERGDLSSARLTRIYLDRLKRYDDQLNCVITLTEDIALRQAALADAEIAAGRYLGPLHGIPWGAKDLLDTSGIRTTWGAEPLVDRVPFEDAHVVQRLADAGAVLVAKLSLGALAYNDIWFGGRTRNPWNIEQGSSGSSAGSAAATVAGLVGFSIGTETYGSIVSPCMRCGATGLRPTFGRVGRSGAMALCWSLDKIGPICRTVEDCILVLDAINGFDERDPSSIDVPLAFDASTPIERLRTGFNPAWFAGERVHDLDREALETMKALGAQLVEIDLPDLPYDTLLTILFAEAAASFEELTRTGQDDLLSWQEPVAWPNTFRKTWFVPAIELVQADRLRRRCMEVMHDVFTRGPGIDLILAPSFAASLLLITNNTGHPSLTIRTGFRDDGSPHGITLIGRLFDEGTLCRAGIAIEREMDAWRQRPLD